MERTTQTSREASNTDYLWICMARITMFSTSYSARPKWIENHWLIIFNLSCIKYWSSSQMKISSDQCEDFDVEWSAYEKVVQKSIKIHLSCIIPRNTGWNHFLGGCFQSSLCSSHITKCKLEKGLCVQPGRSVAGPRLLKAVKGTSQICW